jgi:hypothetical protein
MLKDTLIISINGITAGRRNSGLINLFGVSKLYI